ncbi:hypothetical protein CROQUDRAFT_712326 [Cronartium quercuum f. sp. fusiforme G11]|uniref:Uncharacterized protein n=1 Tax=Cronartium quercuum f. sp. fusiforme G11 TaxID=708437 RepID=A0A9P6NY06_9BASI|nr:hypothetical protein CROQUDRAFT_712326 [Cronartium quercuum f. sp. fusiforme G11]
MIGIGGRIMSLRRPNPHAGELFKAGRQKMLAEESASARASPGMSEGSGSTETVYLGRSFSSAFRSSDRQDSTLVPGTESHSHLESHHDSVSSFEGGDDLDSSSESGDAYHLIPPGTGPSSPTNSILGPNLRISLMRTASKHYEGDLTPPDLPSPISTHRLDSQPSLPRSVSSRYYEGDLTPPDLPSPISTPPLDSQPSLMRTASKHYEGDLTPPDLLSPISTHRLDSQPSLPRSVSSRYYEGDLTPLDFPSPISTPPLDSQPFTRSVTSTQQDGDLVSLGARIGFSPFSRSARSAVWSAGTEDDVTRSSTSSVASLSDDEDEKALKEMKKDEKTVSSPSKKFEDGVILFHKLDDYKGISLADRLGLSMEPSSSNGLSLSNKLSLSIEPSSSKKLRLPIRKPEFFKAFQRKFRAAALFIQYFKKKSRPPVV